ncbi:MAG: recombination protein NinG [bacterium]
MKRRCRNCKGYYPIEDGKIVNEGFYCTEHCIIQYAIKNKSRGSKVIQKERKKHKREYYENDIKTRREAAVYWCNRYIRLRDAGNGCISCGTCKPHIQYAAGHYISAGSCTALRFDERNIHLQCNVRCNQQLSGNRGEYRKRLIEKVGQQVVDFLEGPQPVIKITAEWYKSIEEKYKAKCKELEKSS